MKLGKVLLGCLGLLAARPVLGQIAPGANETFANAVYGFGRASVLAVTGKTYQLYVPINRYGFSHEVPVFQQETNLRRFDAQPQLMAVDKIQSVQTSETYLEHMVLNGRRQHVLALRTVNGPVELFSYVETKRFHMTAHDIGLKQNIGYIPNPDKQHWYLRRQGQLIEVQPGTFAQQLAAYFQDDPATVASLTSGAATYRLLEPLVAAYNQRHPAP
jgi:hypothetical protein